MDSSERRGIILQLLAERGALGYRELAERLKVSSMTVRRDVNRLAALGEVIKTVGGAQRSTAPADFYETRVAGRLTEAIAEKPAIARVAAGTLQCGDSVYLDGGTTTLALVKEIARLGCPLTILTNSFLVCHELRSYPHHTVLSTGGKYDAESFSCFGQMAEDTVSKLHIGKAFLSTKGFVPGEGTFESSIGLLRLKQLVAQRSARVHLLIDHSKFGRRALCQVLAPTQIDVLITDSGADPAIIDATRANGIEVLVAPPEDTAGVMQYAS